MNSWKKTLYIMFTAQLLSALGFSMIFPFLPSYVSSLGSVYGLGTTFLVGAVFSSQAITMTIFSPIWGAVADRFGKKLMVERALFGGSIIILMMAFSTSSEMLIVLRAVQGMITGVVAAGNALVASVVPKERIGYAMGLQSVGLLLGVAIGPLFGGVLADAFGYEMAFYVTSTLLFFGGILVLVGVKENKTEAPQLTKKSNIFKGWKKLLSAEGVGLVYFLRFMSWLGRSVFVPYLPLFLATIVLEEKMLNTATGLIIAVSAAAATLTSVYLGKLGDRIGHKKILIFSAAAVALVYIPQYWMSSFWWLLAFQALGGAFLGGVFPTLSALLNNYIKHGEEGSAYGFDNSIVGLARALSPMFGALIVVVGGFRMIFIFTAILFAITSILAYWKLPEIQKPDFGTSNTDL